MCVCASARVRVRGCAGASASEHVRAGAFVRVYSRGGVGVGGGSRTVLFPLVVPQPLHLEQGTGQQVGVHLGVGAEGERMGNAQVKVLV
jgi:hypothetical protein